MNGLMILNLIITKYFDKPKITYEKDTYSWRFRA